MSNLPYITAPGNIERALQAIQQAATPERVSQDFVKTILKIPGGSGDQVTSYLKKIGFVKVDGTPSEIYAKFRNTSTSGKAAAEALKIGYASLYIRNEYMHELKDDQLRGLIVEETGLEKTSKVVSLVLASIKAIKKFADLSATSTAGKVEKIDSGSVVNSNTEQLRLPVPNANTGGVGLNLSYTINLNLPATPDIAVFNAIFKSLKDNLLKA